MFKFLQALNIFSVVNGKFNSVNMTSNSPFKYLSLKYKTSFQAKTCVYYLRVSVTVEKNKGFADKVVLFTCVLNELIDGLCRISYGRSFHSLLLTREEMSYSIKWFGSE